MTSTELNFHTTTGRLSLDWMATLGDRAGAPIERIDKTTDFERWVREVAGQSLACAPTQDDMRKAKKLRAALVAVMDRLHVGTSPDILDIAVLNQFAALPQLSVKLDSTGRGLLPDSNVSVQVVLGLIARDAIDLFANEGFEKIRSCAAEDCSVYFVDNSRPGKRRWCSMSRCGNKAKKRAFSERNARRKQRLE